MKSKQRQLNRRQFLKAGACASVLPALNQPLIANEKKPILNYKPTMKYRQVGDTGVHVSVISMGGLGFKRPNAMYAIDNGVNLIHMSPTYDGGNSINELGRFLKEKRDKVYIAVKDTFNKGNVHDIDPVLKTLNTDHIDFLMFNRHKSSQVDDPGISEMFEAWKKQGKVRFAGLTTHKQVKACVANGIKSKRFSLIMPVLNQPNSEQISEELKSAAASNIGIMAMKSLKGMDDTDVQMAYIKKLVANPAVTTICKGFPTFDLFDSFMKAMNEALSLEEDQMLYRYAQQNRRRNCMMCGSCEEQCPLSVEISTILRSHQYYLGEMKDRELAETTYRSIPQSQRGATTCDHCRICETACPNGISIVDGLFKAEMELS